MGRYIQATARKRFLCAWKCCSCSHMNVEEPEASMFARENISLFQKEDVAREKARAQASKYLDELLEKIPSFVNEKLNYNQLTKCGTCSSCNTQQPWAKKPPYTVILVVLVIIATVAAVIPFTAFIPFVVLGGIVGFIAALAIGERLNISARRRAAQQISDEYCRPLALTRSIPDYVNRDDPRLKAILAHLATKKSE